MNKLLEESLLYHSQPKPGKFEIHINKKINTKKDLSLAYTPGVSYPVKEIYKNAKLAYKYTNKGNLVGVITNGSSVLGLGNVGALSSKPVMEGKVILFKKLANIDAFDIEITAKNNFEFIDTVCNISPTFGGINLEDIKAPDCFFIEQEIKKRINIPVFHDDQHGTAVVVASALLNALEIQKKKIENIKIICIGAGAAAIASMDLLLHFGVKKSNIFMYDSKGLIYKNRNHLNQYKEKFIQNIDKHIPIEDIITKIDVIIGLSKGNTIKEDLIIKMPDNPIIFALANPIPEINPNVAKAIRNDLIIATGRSDFPNQINNLICFPYIFRGVLDVNAKIINREILISAVHGIRNLTKTNTEYNFGKDYIIPKAMDPRLMYEIPSIISNTALKTNAV